MTDVVLSGYKAAAQTALSTELNTLANDGWSALSPEIDNSSSKYMYADIEVYLAAPSTGWSGTDSALEVYLVPSIDDTNYPTFVVTGTADEQENNAYFIGSITTPGTGTTIHRANIRSVELPSGKFKLAARNRTNDALASSGNTIKWRPWQYASQ